MILFTIRLIRLLRKLDKEKKEKDLSDFENRQTKVNKEFKHTLCAYVKNVRKNEPVCDIKRASIFDSRHIQLASAAISSMAKRKSVQSFLD